MMSQPVKRISIALKPTNYDWLHCESVYYNISMTQIINTWIEKQIEKMKDNMTTHDNTSNKENTNVLPS